MAATNIVAIEQIKNEHPTIEQILAQWRHQLANDYSGYRNHVYRVYYFAQSLITAPDQSTLEQLAIAAAFHDLGIWSDKTFDYLPPSVHRAKQYLTDHNQNHWSNEVSCLIEMHHKLTPYQGVNTAMVEAFRCADLIDVTFGMRSFGIPRHYLRAVKQQFPNNGFHLMLVRVFLNNLIHHPLSPLPMIKL